MHKPQTPRRRLVLLLSAALAVVLTMLTVAPASAAPGRANGKNNRVIFVHGFAPTGKHDCTDYFSAARAHFTKKKWRGNLLTFGYYSGNKKCSYNYKGSRDTSLKTVAKAFANRDVRPRCGSTGAVSSTPPAERAIHHAELPRTS